MVAGLAAQLLALLAPPACAAWLAPVGPAGEVLCPVCRAALPWLRGRRCPRCALPAPCRPCAASRAAFERSWAPVAYDGVARDLVAALKFRGALPLCALMAAQIVATAPQGLLAGALVPVPLHPRRRRERGFDQARRLAGAVGARSGHPVATCLARRGSASRQLGAGRATRLAAGRIDVRAVAPPPRVATLVDDVHTTGATLDACARALLAAGSERVHAVTWARTLR